MGVARRLGTVCREARTDAALRALDIAQAARVSEATISRFETGAYLSRFSERIVAAYERECGLTNDELWRRAIER